MKCENVFCIYQCKGYCTTDNIKIDSLGMCASCIYPNIDEDVLSRAKADLLQKQKKSMAQNQS